MESPFLIFILFGLVVVVFGLLASFQGRARRNAIAEWANSKGWYFHPNKVRGFDDDHPSLECLRKGRDRYAYNIASGKWGDFEVTAFDYHYKTGSGDDETHHRFSAMLVKPEHLLKPLLVRREGFFDKIKSGFGFKDINFESAEFSKKFFVAAPDKSWAYDVIHPRTMEFLMLTHRADLGFSFECDNFVLCVVSKKVLSIEDFKAAHHYGKTILDGIPDYVKQNLAYT